MKVYRGSHVLAIFTNVKQTHSQVNSSDFDLQ